MLQPVFVTALGNGSVGSVTYSGILLNVLSVVIASASTSLPAFYQS